MLCSDALKAEGKPYPRSCMICGLGPCTRPPSPPANGSTIFRGEAKLRLMFDNDDRPVGVAILEDKVILAYAPIDELRACIARLVKHDAR